MRKSDKIGWGFCFGLTLGFFALGYYAYNYQHEDVGYSPSDILAANELVDIVTHQPILSKKKMDEMTPEQAKEYLTIYGSGQ